MSTTGGPYINRNGLVFGYDTGYGVASNSAGTIKAPGQPIENLLALGGSDTEIERSGTSYPYYSVNINSYVQSRWTSSNNSLFLSYEGKRDYYQGGTGGGNDGYPVFYVYFTDWSWSQTLGTGAYDWQYKSKTFTMPDPTGKTVYFSIYHMNSGNPGRSYSRKHMLGFNSTVLPYVNGTRSSTDALIDLAGNSTIPVSTVSYDSTGQPIFDGTDDYIDINTNFGILSSYSFDYVVYTTVNSKMPISSRTSTAFYKYGAHSWKYNHGGTNGEFYHTAGTTNGWSHWTVTYDGSNVRVYQNASSLGSKATTGTADFSQGLKIGWWSAGGSYAFNGKIPVMKMYNRALTEAEIAQNYNSYKNRFDI